MHNPMEQFEIKEIVPLVAGGFNVSFTNSSLLMVISLFVILLGLCLSISNASLKPGRAQVSVEMLHGMIKEMVVGSAGGKALKYAPLIFSLFMFILMCNLLGMIPGSFTVTSHIIITFSLATIVFLFVTILGFIKHGLHYFSLFLPEGTPVFLAPLMIVIEFVSYLMRPVSLSIRLAANMAAGHIVMKVIASFVIISGVLGIIPFALLFVLTGFEFFVAILQAYVFAILSCAYLSDALNLH